MKLEMRCLKFQKLLTAVLCLMLLTIFSPAYAAEVSASVLPVSMISAGDGTITITLKNTNEPAEDGSGTAITDISITPSIPDVYSDTAGASIAPGESKSFSAACYFSEEMLNTSLSFTVSYTEGTRARSKDVSVKVLAAKTSSVTLTRSASTKQASPGEEITLTYRISNTGDAPITVTSLVDREIGGKDSMLMAKLMQELQRHSDVPFELVFLVMDPGYNEINRQKIESNAELLHIPVTIFESNIFSVANNTEKNPCYLCARMRRGHLYSKAKELGCNKIALGHHFNDVIETTVMSMFYGSQLQAMPPKLHSTSFPGMTLIRPMYCIREEDILAWKRYNDLEFIQCACRFTENCTMCDNGGGGSKRQETKILLRRLKRDNPNIENSIFRSIHAVALDTMPGYKSEGVEHSFLERFHEMEERS